MNRRTFLGAIPVAVAGCSRPAPPGPRADRIEREAHLAMLEASRVPANAIRTTPKPTVDPLDRFPELKPLARVAVRLHPRYGDEPKVHESKLGGAVLWPDGEPWPPCPEFRIPMAAVLQVRADDLAPQFPVRPKTDLFQLFWTPRATKAGPPHVVGVWRSEADIRKRTANPELPDSADLGFVPVPCRLHPERVSELPPVEAMPESMRKSLIGSPDQFARSRGTKLGGWPRDSDAAPKCSTCVWPMDYLLAVDSCEWTTTDDRWKPKEDKNEEGYRRAAGFQFGEPDASIQVYICKRCEAWPLRAAIVK